MNALEKLCADIIYGKAFKDKPELWEQILRECWYNVEKIKEDLERVARFRASAEYEDYLNSIGLDSYHMQKDMEAETHEYDEKVVEDIVIIKQNHFKKIMENASYTVVIESW